MPLYTSSSSPAGPKTPVSGSNYRGWTIVTVICLAALCVSLEIVTRLGFRHTSRIESRIARTYKSASELRRTPGKQTILLIGNSLPLEGINLPQLEQSMGSSTICVPFFVEQTQYLDWYYGIRRLINRGSDPEVIVLSMNVPHLIANSIRGDYSAYYLFRASDISAVAHEAQYDLTKTSSLVLSHFSLFYAGRNPLRNFLLGKIDRPYADLLHTLSTRPAPSIPLSTVEQIATSRLRDLLKLTEAHGIRLVFLLPPGFGSEEAVLIRSGQRAGTQVMIPIHLNEFGATMFRDGFHVNDAGARIFTERFSEMLGRYLKMSSASR